MLRQKHFPKQAQTGRKKRGFTLVELLVVIAIIGILIALLLPAVQAAREAARRMSCSNNIHQLAVALNSYHSSHNTFPAGAFCPTTDSDPGGSTIMGYHTWLESLLPFIEQTAVYERIDFTVKTYEGVNPDVLNGVEIAFLKCPSDPDAGLMDNGRCLGYTPGPAGTFSMAETYAPSGGPLHMNDCLLGVQGDYNCQDWHGGDGRVLAETEGKTGAPGMFSGGPWMRKIGDCTDGTSHTFLLGETLPIYSAFRMYFASHMNVGTTNPPPNHWKADTVCQPGAIMSFVCHAYMGGFNSLHPGGVTMAMTDGSVQFIVDDIDYDVWTYLGDREDGQVIGGGVY